MSDREEISGGIVSQLLSLRREVRVAAPIEGTPLAEALAAPERLLARPDARFVKDHRRTAVAAIRVDGRELFVKRFKPYAWYRRLEAALWSTPARRCWESSAALEHAGFHVPAALALVETRRLAIPESSYFVTAAIAGAEPAGSSWIRAKLEPAVRRRLLETAAVTLRRLHDRGFYSRDANADNFLVRIGPGGEPEFYLLDLENVRTLGRVSTRRRLKNLVQLYRPVRGRVRRNDRLRFVAAYLRAGSTPQAVASAVRDVHARLRDWLSRLDFLDRRKEAEYRKRRAC